MPSMHEICAHEPGESGWVGHDIGDGLGQAQRQEGDQGDGDLDADGVFAGADELCDFEGLFDPAEEHLDGPAPLLEAAISWAGASRSLERMRSTLPVSVVIRTSRTASCIGFCRFLA